MPDCPFLVCVFYVPFNEMIFLWQQKKEETQSKLSKEWLFTCSMRQVMAIHKLNLTTPASLGADFQISWI